MNRNKVYLLAGIVMIALSAGGWLLYGLQGSLSVSHAQSQTCTGQPSGYFFEDWAATQMSYVDTGGRILAVGRGSENADWSAGGALYTRMEQAGGSPNNMVALAAAAAIAPTKWQVTGRICP